MPAIGGTTFTRISFERTMTMLSRDGARLFGLIRDELFVRYPSSLYLTLPLSVRSLSASTFVESHATYTDIIRDALFPRSSYRRQPALSYEAVVRRGLSAALARRSGPR